MLISVLSYASIVCCTTDQKILLEKTSVQNHDVQSILQIHFRLDSCVNEDHTIIMKKRIAQFKMMSRSHPSNQDGQIKKCLKVNFAFESLKQQMFQ